MLGGIRPGLPAAIGGGLSLNYVAQKVLLREVWDPAYEGKSYSLRVYVAQLRRKLEPDPSHPVHLLTEAGMGYRFEP